MVVEPAPIVPRHEDNRVLPGRDFSRNGANHTHSSSMVLGFNASSSRTLPSAQMVPKTRANPQSGFLLVSTSPAPDKDFTCNPIWRWGDYSGASPDHASTSGSVWLNVM